MKSKGGKKPPPPFGRRRNRKLKKPDDIVIVAGCRTPIGDLGEPWSICGRMNSGQ